MKEKLYIYISKLLKDKLFKDSFWSLLGSVIFRGLALVAGIIIARFLGKDVFGEYSLIKATFIAAALFSSFGLKYTSTKFIAEYTNKDKTKLKLIIDYSNRIVLLISIIVAFLFFVFANYISEVMLDAKHLSFYIRIFGVLTILNAMTELQSGLLAGFGEFKKMSKINMIVGLTTFLLTIILVYFFGFNGALVTLLLVQSINLILNFRLVRHSLPKNVEYSVKDYSILSKIIKYSTPIAIQEAVYAVLSWAIIYLVLLYDSFGEVGLFKASLQLNAIILFIPGMLRNVILSHLSIAENDETRHSKVMNTVLGINFIATFIPAVLLFFTAGYVAKLYGGTFIGLDGLIRVAVFITVFTSISNVYSQAYMSKNMNWAMLAFRFVRDVGTIVVFLAMIKYIESVAKSMIYSQLVLNVVFMLIMIIYYRVKINRKEVNEDYIE